MPTFRDNYIKVVRISAFVFLLFLCNSVFAQKIYIAKQEIKKLPCKVFQNSRLEQEQGYYNDKDKSLYDCNAHFVKYLSADYIPLTDWSCNEGALAFACNFSQFPRIYFAKDNTTISKDALHILSIVGQQMRANPNCSIKIYGYVSNTTNAKARQLAWDRIHNVITYLEEKQGISEARLLFSYGGKGRDSHTLDIQGTDATTSDTLAPLPAKPRRIIQK